MCSGSSARTRGSFAPCSRKSAALLFEAQERTIEEMEALAGECMDQLFESVYYLRPVADFREEASRALPGLEADKLIDLCQTTSSPRVSFETAEPKIV